MSPSIEIEVKSVGKSSPYQTVYTNYSWLTMLHAALDAENLRLYVSMHQNFRIFIIPFYCASVSFTSLLKLTEGREQPQTPPPLSPSVRAATADRHMQFQPVPSSPLSRHASISDEPEEDGDWTHAHHREQQQRDSDTSSNELPSPRRPERGASVPTLSPILPPLQRRYPRRVYYISSQEDMYQTSEFIKFIVPFGIGATLVAIFHFFATLFCLAGVLALWPVTWAEEKGYLPLRGRPGDMWKMNGMHGMSDRGRSRGKPSHRQGSW
jgi:hypothetical protein